MSAFPGRRELSVGGPTAPLYHISRMYASHLMAFSTPRFRHRHERDQLLRITVRTLFVDNRNSFSIKERKKLSLYHKTMKR